MEADRAFARETAARGVEGWLDFHLEDARNQMSRKYGGKNESTARGRNRRWIVVVPERTVTWDNFKIKRL